MVYSRQTLNPPKGTGNTQLFSVFIIMQSYLNRIEVQKETKAYTQKFFDSYQKLWSSTPVPLPREGQDRVLIQAAIPEVIPEARFFPSGYQQCLHLLNPDTVWISWKYVRDGETMGMSYNGLVWLEDRFKFFPKPWRMWKD